MYYFFLNSIWVLTLCPQGPQHDEDGCGAALWADGGRVPDQRGSDSPSDDDGVCDGEAPQGKLSPGAAGQVQELLPDGQSERRGRAVRRTASGGGVLRASL